MRLNFLEDRRMLRLIELLRCKYLVGPSLLQFGHTFRVVVFIGVCGGESQFPFFQVLCGLLVLSEAIVQLGKQSQCALVCLVYARPAPVGSFKQLAHEFQCLGYLLDG